MATAKSKQSWSEYLASMLNKAATDIGEFQVQLALGKAEARDEYERLKKDLRKTFSQQSPLVIAGKAHLKKIQAVFDQLQVHLALGKADTADAFAAQKKVIVAELNKLDTLVNGLPKNDKVRHELRNEIEVAKIKLEILRLHYHYSEITPEENLKKVNALKERISKIHEHGELDDQLHKVEREISSSYKQMKKVFSS